MIGTEHRVGVVGAGLMGVRHAEAFGALRGVQVTGVYDLDPAAASRFSDTFGARAYPSLEALIADDKIDVIVIATGDCQHLEAAIGAIEADRHVLVEKPLASDVGEAVRIAEAAASSGRVVAVGHQVRFDAQFAGAGDRVRGGEFGPVVHCAFRRNSSIAGPSKYGASTALAWHVLVHDIDLLRYMTGHEVVAVTAKGAKLSRTDADLDSLLVLADLSGSAIASFEASWILPASVGTSLDAIANIVCVEGSVSVTTAHQGLAVYAQGGASFPDTVRYAPVDGRPSGLVHAQAASFIRAVDGEPSSALCRPADALSAVRVADAVTRSLQSGRAESVSSGGCASPSGGKELA